MSNEIDAVVYSHFNKYFIPIAKRRQAYLYAGDIDAFSGALKKVYGTNDDEVEEINE